jgi:hypothetical protein
MKNLFIFIFSDIMDFISEYIESQRQIFATTQIESQDEDPQS